MFSSTNSIFGCQAVIFIMLVLAIEHSSAPRKSTAATPIAPRQLFGLKRGITSQRQRRQNKGSYVCIKNEIQAFDQSIILNVIRGGSSSVNDGSSSAEKEEYVPTVVGAEIEAKPAIIAVGVVRILEKGPSRFGSCPSIILLVDDNNKNDDIIIDEVLLRRKIFSLFQDKQNDTSISISSKKIGDTENILESLVILCDILVMQLGKAETLPPELMACVVRGNQQRESAGMERGKLWLSAATGAEHELRRFINSDIDESDDNRCQQNKTTWSTLFSPCDVEIESGGRNNEFLHFPALQELFTSFSQEVILSNFYSKPTSAERKLTKSSTENTLFDYFPSVSVRYLNKKSRHGALGDAQIKKDPFSSKKGKASINLGVQTSLRFPEISDEMTTELSYQQQDYNEKVEDIIEIAYQRLGDLEEKMQELVLDRSLSTIPLLEFGDFVGEILYTAERKLDCERGVDDNFRRDVMKGIFDEVQRLYKEQLQALRNYYGQRYESILDAEFEDENQNHEAIERKWAAGAEHLTQAFIAAALNAVPVMYRAMKNRNQASFNHVDTLQGLIQDMMESTERRKDEHNLATMLVANFVDEDTADKKSSFSRKDRLHKIPKWLESLGARAFVFGANYVQGWLAWQGIKRAALERDRTQPKFPLF